ncbi:MAG: NAD(P)-dependent oxidoreductase [Verrucomicrobiota bacterium]
MRCLVTGASGHLGSHLVRALLQQGHEVTGAVRPISDTWRLTDVLSKINVIHVDLADIDRAGPAIVTAAPEVVFHLAWSGVTRQYRDDARQIAVNLTGTEKLLGIIEQVKPRCFVGLGSQAETQATQYGVAKLQASHLARQACERAGVRYVWLRLFATYGPADDTSYLIPSVILQLLAGKKPALTSGEQKCDYLYVEDAAEAICCASDAQGVFDLASGTSRPVREIVTMIRDLIDPTLPLGFGEIPGGGVSLVADITGLQQTTGWKPRVSLEDGLRRTVAWYRGHR